MAINPYRPPEARLERQPSAGGAPALWNPDAIGNWSLMFTPIFGSILVAANWEALGEESRARTARIWAWLAAPLVLGGIFTFILWYVFVNRRQAKYVREKWGTDYPRQPWGKPLGIAFGVWFGMFTLFFLLALAAAPR